MHCTTGRFDPLAPRFTSRRGGRSIINHPVRQITLRSKQDAQSQVSVRVEQASPAETSQQSAEDHAPSASPQTISPPSTTATSAPSDAPDGGLDAKVLAPLAVVGGLVGIGVAAYVFKGQITDFMDFFTHAVESWGVWGYIAYMVVYAALELLAVPAIPLTMTAGPIFGVAQGTAAVSISSVVAATLAFLIARYAARDKVEEMAKRNPKFQAIDKAVGKNGFQVVLLLRLSPLLPLALSNYLYGLTSVELGQYVLGSWLGMFPGTLAYVSAGYYGLALVSEGSSAAGGVATWQLAVGAAVTGAALWYIARLAKNALDEAEKEAGSNGGTDTQQATAKATNGQE